MKMVRYRCPTCGQVVEILDVPGEELWCGGVYLLNTETNGHPKPKPHREARMEKVNGGSDG